MKTLIFLSALLSSSFAFAQVEFQPAQQILMQGATCQELEKFGQSIANWTLSINSTLQLPQPECFCSAKSCQMNVAEISPYLVTELTNFQISQTESAYNGPNCFNAALYAAKTLPTVTFTHPYEMTMLMASSLCKERQIDEPLQPGDILVVRDQSTPLFEIHAGVYIDGQLSFSKYGENKMMPYSYGLDVHRAYGVQQAECARVKGAPAPGSPCYQKPYVNFYSCKAMYSFVSQIFNQPGGIHEAVRSVYAQTSSLDNKISAIAFKGQSIKPEDLEWTQNELARLYRESVAISKTTTLNDENNEFLKIIHHRIYSMYEQTRRIAIGLGQQELAKTALANPSL